MRRLRRLSPPQRWRAGSERRSRSERRGRMGHGAQAGPLGHTQLLPVTRACCTRASCCSSCFGCAREGGYSPQSATRREMLAVVLGPTGKPQGHALPICRAATPASAQIAHCGDAGCILRCALRHPTGLRLRGGVRAAGRRETVGLSGGGAPDGRGGVHGRAFPIVM